MLKHRGGSLDIWDAKGNKVGTIHYGPGLHKKCEDCKQPRGVRCTTASGKPLNKTHKSRI